MRDLPVNFQLPNSSKVLAFRRLTILPRVGEVVTFNDKNFMVVQMVHHFLHDQDEQIVYIAIEERT
jgi:hypothetical protein